MKFNSNRVLDKIFAIRMATYNFRYHLRIDCGGYVYYKNILQIKYFKNSTELDQKI